MIELQMQNMALELIKHLEGCKLNAYQDSAHLWTLGYGNRFFSSGAVIKEGDSCTLAQAKAMLEIHLQKHVFPQLKKYDLSGPVYASLASLIYNIGSLGDTIKSVVVTRNWAKLPECFRTYVYIDGKICQGLKNRREEEIKFFMGDKYTPPTPK